MRTALETIRAIEDKYYDLIDSTLDVLADVQHTLERNDHALDLDRLEFIKGTIEDLYDDAQALIHKPSAKDVLGEGFDV